MLVNAYDNGKSTGDIRKHYNKRILGPSDVRKNQTRMNILEGGSKNLSDFLEHRFNADYNEEAKRLIQKEFNTKYEEKYSHQFNFVKFCIEKFFDSLSLDRKWEDYSIGNILYGYLANVNGNSLQIAADVMKNVLDLKTTVVLNSDESLFLHAITQSGKILECEADIVDWDSTEPIKETFFTDKFGNVKKPILSDRALEEIKSADIIVLSTGTQWSSLIPTYQTLTGNSTVGDLLSTLPIKKYLMMNAEQDRDMIGLNGDDILDVLDNYIDTTQFVITAGHNDMTPSRTSLFLETNSKKYEPEVVANTIMRDFFNNPNTNDFYCFDWDNTLTISPVPEDLKETVKYNTGKIESLNSCIVTGNSVNVVTSEKTIYAEGGVNKYVNGIKTCLDEKGLISETEFLEFKEILKEYNSDVLSKVTLREEACISIKPLTNTERIDLHKFLYKKLKDKYEVRKTGKTTIDINKSINNKLLAFNDIAKGQESRIFYVGDELEHGNDSVVKEYKGNKEVHFISVNNPRYTQTFLRSIKEI